MLGFPLGILSAAGAGGVPFESDYELISTTVLGTAAASVTFSSLGDYSSIYKHLQIRYVTRSSRSAGNSAMSVRLNGDTGSNYAFHLLRGNGTDVASAAVASTSNAELAVSMPAASATANSFVAGVADFLDVYSSSKNTTIRNFSGTTTSNYINLNSVLWNDTASITSIELYEYLGNNLVAGSRFSLYGIKG
jgi:hypothetical protein